MSALTPISTRYTYPTCTLEVWSGSRRRWVQPPRSPGFCLKLRSLESSGNADENSGTAVQTVQGNQAQLQSLGTAVETYVQQFLAQTPVHLNSQIYPQEESIPETALVLPATATEELVAAVVAPVPVTVPMLTSPEPNIYLSQRDWLCHELHLGFLSEGTTGAEKSELIALGISQLFDLAAALEDWQQQTRALPVLDASRPRSWLAATPIWLRSTAIAALVVAATTSALNLSQRLTSPPQILLSRETGESAVAPGPAPPPPPPGAFVIPPPPPAAKSPIPSSPRTETIPQAELHSSQPLPVVPPPTQVLPPPPPAGFAAPPPQPIEQPASPAAPQNFGDIIAGKPLEIPPPQAATSEDRTDSSEVGPVASSPLAAGNSRNRLSAKTNNSGATSQVAEVQAYFAQRWQPPPELPSALEYSLILNPDGTINRVMPLGKTAALFLDRTQMPLINEPFVSPGPGPSYTRIRLVLEKNGTVRAFPEAIN